MANFHTHLNVGIFVSAGMALGFHALGAVEPGQTLGLFTLGVVGALLPDIDADGSRPVAAAFSTLGAVIAFAMILPLLGRFGLAFLIMLWAGVYLCVRYGLFSVFTRHTVHRGVWHSWLAAALAMLLTADLAYWWWHCHAVLSWVAGIMVAVGYLAHLMLDEFYSVDLHNARLRRSFGTAFKPLSLTSPGASLAMAAVVAALAWWAPPADLWRQFSGLLDPGDWQRLVQRLWRDLQVFSLQLSDWLRWLQAYLGRV